MERIIDVIMWDENDSVSCVMDAIFGAPGPKLMYENDKSSDWIKYLGFANVEDAVREMPMVEKEILKKYFLDGLTISDIASDLNMPIELLYGHIRAMKERLMLYV